jgi:hypothetical protein
LSDDKVQDWQVAYNSTFFFKSEDDEYE